MGLYPSPSDLGLDLHESPRVSIRVNVVGREILRTIDSCLVFGPYDTALCIFQHLFHAPDIFPVTLLAT